MELEARHGVGRFTNSEAVVKTKKQPVKVKHLSNKTNTFQTKITFFKQSKNLSKVKTKTMIKTLITLVKLKK